MVVYCQQALSWPEQRSRLVLCFTHQRRTCSANKPSLALGIRFLMCLPEPRGSGLTTVLAQGLGGSRHSCGSPGLIWQASEGLARSQARQAPFSLLPRLLLRRRDWPPALLLLPPPPHSSCSRGAASPASPPGEEERVTSPSCPSSSHPAAAGLLLSLAWLGFQEVGKGRQRGGWEQERKGRGKCWAKQLWPSLLPAAHNLSLPASAQTPSGCWGGDAGGLYVPKAYQKEKGVQPTGLAKVSIANQ